MANLEQRLKSELGATERLLWVGQPRQGVFLCGADMFLIPISFMWCGFAIFWELSVFQTGAPFFFKLWGIPFVFIGLYLVLGRFFVDSMQRAKTIYGLTNERILILSGLTTPLIKSLNLQTLSDLSMMEKSDRSGNILFGAVPPFYRWIGGASWPGKSRVSSSNIELIDNVKDVYEKIRQAQNELLRR